jgi:hypothetical protein
MPRIGLTLAEIQIVALRLGKLGFASHACRVPEGRDTMGI